MSPPPDEWGEDNDEGDDYGSEMDDYFDSESERSDLESEDAPAPHLWPDPFDAGTEASTPRRMSAPSSARSDAPGTSEKTPRMGSSKSPPRSRRIPSKDVAVAEVDRLTTSAVQSLTAAAVESLVLEAFAQEAPGMGDFRACPDTWWTALYSSFPMQNPCPAAASDAHVRSMMSLPSFSHSFGSAMDEERLSQPGCAYDDCETHSTGDGEITLGDKMVCLSLPPPDGVATDMSALPRRRHSEVQPLPLALLHTIHQRFAAYNDMGNETRQTVAPHKPAVWRVYGRPRGKPAPARKPDTQVRGDFRSCPGSYWAAFHDSAWFEPAQMLQSVCTRQEELREALDDAVFSEGDLDAESYPLEDDQLEDDAGFFISAGGMLTPVPEEEPGEISMDEHGLSSPLRAYVAATGDLVDPAGTMDTESIAEDESARRIQHAFRLARSRWQVSSQSSNVVADDPVLDVDEAPPPREALDLVADQQHEEDQRKAAQDLLERELRAQLLAKQILMPVVLKAVFAVQAIEAASLEAVQAVVVDTSDQPSPDICDSECVQAASVDVPPLHESVEEDKCTISEPEAGAMGDFRSCPSSYWVSFHNQACWLGVARAEVVALSSEGVAATVEIAVAEVSVVSLVPPSPQKREGRPARKIVRPSARGTGVHTVTKPRQPPPRPEKRPPVPRARRNSPRDPPLSARTAGSSTPRVDSDNVENRTAPASPAPQSAGAGSPTEEQCYEVSEEEFERLLRAGALQGCAAAQAPPEEEFAYEISEEEFERLMQAGQLQLAAPGGSSNDTHSTGFAAAGDYAAPAAVAIPPTYEYAVDPNVSAYETCAHQAPAIPEVAAGMESPQYSLPDDYPMSARTESEYDACSEAPCSEAPSTSASVAPSTSAPSKPRLPKSGSRGAVKRREPKTKPSGGGLFFLPTDGVPVEGLAPRPLPAARSTHPHLGLEVAMRVEVAQQEENETEVPESIGVEDWEDNFRASDRVAAGSPLHSARLLRGLRSPSEPNTMTSVRSVSLPPSRAGEDEFQPLAPKRRPPGLARAPPCRLPRIPLPGAKASPMSKPQSPVWDDPSSTASGHASFRQLVPLPGRKISSLSAPRRLAPLS